MDLVCTSFELISTYLKNTAINNKILDYIENKSPEDTNFRKKHILKAI